MEKKVFEDIRPLTRKVMVQDELTDVYMKTLTEFPDSREVSIMRDSLVAFDGLKREMFDKKKERYKFFESNLNKWLEIEIKNIYGVVTDIFYFFPYDINDINHYVFGLFSPKRTNNSDILYESGLFERSFDVYSFFNLAFTAIEVNESEVIENIEKTYKDLLKRRYEKCGNT